MAPAPFTLIPGEHGYSSSLATPREPAREGRGRAEYECVLVVDEDRRAVDTCTQALQDLRLASVWAGDGQRALAAAHDARVRLLLVELKLPDIPGLDLVRTMRAEGMTAPFIVISGCATVSLTVEAMALGALNVLEKPLRGDDLRTAVTSAIVRAEQGGAPYPDALAPVAEPRTPCERWRDFVMSLILSDHDLKTNGAWARHVGVSLSVLREACRLVHIAPHDARDFARMLRAIWRSDRVWKPETVLNFADARTLNKLETRSGFKGRREAGAPTVEEFFGRQRWIPSDNPALLTVRTLMTRRVRA